MIHVLVYIVIALILFLLAWWNASMEIQLSEMDEQIAEMKRNANQWEHDRDQYGEILLASFKTTLESIKNRKVQP